MLEVFPQLLLDGVEHKTSEHQDNQNDDTASWYLHSVSKLVSRKFKLLTRDEEIQLAQQIENGNIQAKQALAQANLRLVISIAKRYAGRGANLMDLVQEGNLGLMKAIEKFDHRVGCKFSTYATFWIKQSVFQAFAEHDRPIRLPSHVMDYVMKLRKARQALKDKLDRSPSDAEIAAYMGISIKKVSQLTRVSMPTMSMEAEVTLKDGNTQTLAETIEDERQVEPEQKVFRQQALNMLQLALVAHLEPRERDILFRRYGLLGESSEENMSEENTPVNSKSDKSKKETLEDIGQHYGVTRECIRQTEQRAIRKLRQSSFFQKLLE